MKISTAQLKPEKGNVHSNISTHIRLVNLALDHGVDTIIFPELSITGYEPELAKELATTAQDENFNIFSHISSERNMTIGIGIPTRNERGICISALLFQPGKPRQLYSKQYLHPDEEPYFVSGQNSIGLTGREENIALAICYELSIPAHSQNAFNSGAQIYIASVAKHATGVEKAGKELSEIAAKYSMPVLMSNCVGYCDNFESAGKTAVWNRKGELVGQLNDKDEGIVIYDTETEEVCCKILIN